MVKPFGTQNWRLAQHLKFKVRLRVKIARYRCVQEATKVLREAEEAAKVLRDYTAIQQPDPVQFEPPMCTGQMTDRSLPWQTVPIEQSPSLPQTANPVCPPSCLLHALPSVLAPVTAPAASDSALMPPPTAPSSPQPEPEIIEPDPPGTT